MTTIAEAKQHLRDNWEEGIVCPCCGQDVKLYKRRIYKSMAICLIKLYKLTVQGNTNFYFHVSEFDATGGDFAKLSYWGLIKEKINQPGQKGRTSGYWLITNLGTAYVKNLVGVERFAKIFDGRLVGFEGEQVKIREALGKTFDYEEMMRG